MASCPRSPVRMRMTSSTLVTKIFPSPIRPVRADFSTSSTTWATRSSGTMISILSLGRKSTTYSAPRYSSVCPFCRPNPLTSETVIPWTPMSFRASFTSSSLNGLMMASIFFMSSPPSSNDQSNGRTNAASASPNCRRKRLFRSDSIRLEDTAGGKVDPCGNGRASVCTFLGQSVPAACAGSFPGRRPELALLAGEEAVDVLPVGVDHEERHHEGEGHVMPRPPEERHGDGEADGGAQRPEGNVPGEVQHGGEEDDEEEGSLRRKEQHDAQGGGDALSPPEAEVHRKDLPENPRPADRGEPVVGGRVQDRTGQREGEDPFPHVEQQGENPRRFPQRARDVRRADVPRPGLTQVHLAVERLRDEDTERYGAEKVAEEDEGSAAEEGGR